MNTVTVINKYGRVPEYTEDEIVKETLQHWPTVTDIAASMSEAAMANNENGLVLMSVIIEKR